MLFELLCQEFVKLWEIVIWHGGKQMMLGMIIQVAHEERHKFVADNRSSRAHTIVALSKRMFRQRSHVCQLLDRGCCVDRRRFRRLDEPAMARLRRKTNTNAPSAGVTLQ